MKKFQCIAAGLLVAVILVSCNRFSRGNHMIISNSDNEYLEINYDGDIRFNDDETTIESISHNGYLKYRKNNKKLTAENSPNGGITYTLSDDGNRLSISDNAGKAFLKDAIQDMIEMGFDAQRRIERLYRKGGKLAVLDAVDNVKGDNLKSIYLEYLLSTDSLSKHDMSEIARKISTEIGSDFEKSKLLNKFSGDYVKDSSIATAYLEAVKSIGSDFEKSNVLKNISKQSLSGERLDQVLDVTGTVGSDFEKENIVHELINSQAFAGEQYSRLLEVIDHVGSDFEKKNLINHLLDKDSIPGDQFDKVMNVVGNVGSDFERTNLLNKLTGRAKSDEQWISLINAAGKIPSDFDKSNVLVEIAKKMPASELVKAAFKTTARTINSDTDYARVARAIE